MSDRPVEVEKIATWIPVSAYNILDSGTKDPELLKWAHEVEARDKARAARYWRSLPWYVRAHRRFNGWRSSVEDSVMVWLHARLFSDCDGYR